jgi:hypothetical protein
MGEITGSKNMADRRSFLRTGIFAGGAAGVLGTASALRGQTRTITDGDVAILRFLAAAEIIEADLWIQYNELGGVLDSEVPGPTSGSGSPAYIKALQVLDSDMPQYIHDNTEDEISHYQFLNGYLASIGATPVNLDIYRTLPSSTATGARQIGRLTNLMQLSVDTSWFTRYRIGANNPDLDPSFQFPQAIPSLMTGQHPAIPRSDADLTPANHIQAIANTAGFHFAFIEQGGTSVYPSLAQRVTSVDVLRILLSIGPTEAMHFQTWQDKAGNAPPLTDSGLVFPDLNSPPFGGETFQTNLIMPEPCPFLDRKLPVCSIARPTKTDGAAMGAINSFIADGLFIGQSDAFMQVIGELALLADSAVRGM